MSQGLDVNAPGIRSFESDPQLVALPALATDVCLMAGVTERGRLTAFTANSFPEWVNEYGGITADSFDAYIAAWGYFDNGGRNLVTERIVHYTDLADTATKASAPGLIAITTATTNTYGSVSMGTAAPSRLDPGDTLVFAIDGGGDETATFDAARAFRTGAGAAVGGFVGGETLTLILDNDGITQTITMQAGDITVALVIARINSELEGGHAEISGGQIRIYSDTYGTDSDVDITGGTGRAAMGLAIGDTAGTGDVANIRAVTALEIQTVVVADCASLSVVEVTISTNIVTFATPTLGAGGSIQCKAASTADDAAKCNIDNALHTGTAAGAGTMSTATAASDGAWINGWALVVSNAKNGDANYFDGELLDANGVRKRYWANMITTTTDPDYFMDRINDDAENYYFTVSAGIGTAPANRPTNGTYTFASGDSGLALLVDADYVGNSAGPTGFYAFDATENARTLICPGKGTSTVHNGMVTYCDTWRNKTIIGIMDPPETNTEAQIRTYFVTTASLKGSSEMVEMIWPRGHIHNPRPAVLTNDAVVTNNIGVVNIPLSGHYAGVFARNDARLAGVYQPPAGTDGVLRGVLGVEIIATGQEKHDVDNPRKRANVYDDLINPVRKGAGGVFVDGTRMAKADGNFPTIGQRRGACHIKLTIETGIPFATHKNIKPPLLRKIDRSVRIWLELQTRNGAFVSDEPAEAFNWNVGLDKNPPSVQLQRKINAGLGLAFAEPADFVDLELYKDIRRYEEELAGGA
jgi:hypothetical protein